MRVVAWCGLLVVAGLLVVVGVSAADPDWPGTVPVQRSNGLAAWHPVVGAGAHGRLLVAWSEKLDASGDYRDIFETHSVDGGRSWSQPAVISATQGKSLLPDVLDVDGDVFVAWCELAPSLTMEVYEAGRSGYAGAWAVRRVPVPPSHSGIDTWPRLAASPGRLHLAFNGGPVGGIPDILVTSRSLAGGPWLTATVVHTHTGLFGGSWYPVLAVGPGGQTLHMVWEERSSSVRATIMYLSGTVAGGNIAWRLPAVTLSPPDIKLVAWPDIAVDAEGDVHVVWAELVDEPADQCTGPTLEQYVRYTRFDAASGQWLSPTVRIDSNPTCVNDETPRSVAPRLVLSGEEPRACVVWHGYRPGGATAEEVLLSCSSSLPDGWPPPANVSRSLGAGEMSIIPSIAADPVGQLHIAWQERSGPSPFDDYQIDYARSLYQMFLPAVLRRP